MQQLIAAPAANLSPGLDDSRLIATSQAGDQDAFAYLVQLHQRRGF